MSNVCRHSRHSSSALILTIQLTLAHMMFELHGPNLNPKLDTFNFAESQRIVYASALVQPIFRGRSREYANIDFALHCVNFFKTHLTCASEHTGYPEYSALAAGKRPQPYQPQAEKDVGRLGRNWIGTYGTLHSRPHFKLC